MKEKYLNPFTDFGFKKIFGEEANKDILIAFLNSLLKGKEVIKNLTFKNPEQLGIARLDRRAIFDLYCENDKGENFIIELQKSKQQFFKRQFGIRNIPDFYLEMGVFSKKCSKKRSLQ